MCHKTVAPNANANALRQDAMRAPLKQEEAVLPLVVDASTPVVSTPQPILEPSAACTTKVWPTIVSGLYPSAGAVIVMEPVEVLAPAVTVYVVVHGSATEASHQWPPTSPGVAQL